MKRLILTLLIASPMISFAETKSGYELVLDVVYAKKINKTIDRVNSIYGHINSYILRYGKLPTKADLKLSSTMYQAFDKNKVFDFNADEEKVTFFNIVKNLPFKQLSLYKNSPSLKTLAVVNDDLSMTIALDPKSITFLKEMKKYNASLNEPSDKSQTWYKPNGNGGFNIYRWDTNLKRWKLLDSIKLQDDMKKDMKTIYTFATKDELNTTKPKNGDIAYINENTNSIQKYIFDANQSKWLLVSSAISAKNYEICSKDDIGVLRFDKDKNCMTSCQKDGTKYKWECMEDVMSPSKKIYNSCYAIKKENPSAKDGVYTIDPDGIGGVAPFKVYCDMTTDGGGWTLVAKVLEDNSDFYYNSSKWNGIVFNDSDFNLNKKNALYKSFNTVKGNEILIYFFNIDDVKINLPKENTIKFYAHKSTITNSTYGQCLSSPPSWYDGKWALQTGATTKGTNLILPCFRARFGIVADNTPNNSCVDSFVGIGGEHNAVGNNRSSGVYGWPGDTCQGSYVGAKASFYKALLLIR